MTNKIALRTVEEFMADYTPVYNPIYPLFLSNGKAQQYAAEVGKRDFRRIEAVGDLRGKHVTPKDTETHQISSVDKKKPFRSYFLTAQFVLSQWQNREGVEQVVSQVLDEHHVQADELLLLGEGSSTSTMLNNGLYWSDDSNYTLEGSVEVEIDTNGYHLTDLHSTVVSAAQKANQVAGRKVVIFYGTDMLPKVNSLYPNTQIAFKRALQDVLGANYSIIELPEGPTPSGANGFAVVNLDQCKLHYTMLPQLMSQGNNEEKMYLWFNFAMGSMMLEVLAKNGIIRQPCTFEAPEGD